VAKRQTARMEDYLEAIHLLAQEEGTAKVSGLAKRLGVKMPALTRQSTSWWNKGFQQFLA